MKQIKLTNNKLTIVDNDDYIKYNKFKWYAHYDGYHYYPVRTYRYNGIQKTIRLYRKIMNAKRTEKIDHINGNTLDNRKCNLRICSASENQMNRSKTKKNASGYKGVYWNNYNKKWQVGITFNKQKIHLGYFKDIKKAAKAYNKAAIKYHKKFAKLNKDLK